MTTTPPGWYPDPWHPAYFRYWDGGRWTAALALDAERAHLLPAQADEPSRTLPFVVAIGALVSLAVPLVISRVLLRALASQEWPIAMYVVIAGVLAYGPPLVFWRYASRRWGSGRPRQDVGMSMKWVDLGFGPLTWIACIMAQVVVAIVVNALHIPFKSNTDTIEMHGSDRGYVITLLVLSVVAAPIIEEIIFRGMVLRGFLSRMPVAAAIGLQGVLFGMAHFSPERGVKNIGLIMVLGGVGVVLGVSAYLVRRLAPTMIAHAIINGIAMAVVLTGWTPGSTDAVVVDQAHVVEPHRSHGHGVLVGDVDGDEAVLVHQFEVLEPGQRFGVHDGPADGDQVGRVAFTVRVRLAQRA
jgi:membrane protease YdiL (CAAX protease family)